MPINNRNGFGSGRSQHGGNGSMRRGRHGKPMPKQTPPTGGRSGRSCRSSIDCRGNYTCQNGECVKPIRLGGISSRRGRRSQQYGRVNPNRRR